MESSKRRKLSHTAASHSKVKAAVKSHQPVQTTASASRPKKLAEREPVVEEESPSEAESGDEEEVDSEEEDVEDDTPASDDENADAADADNQEGKRDVEEEEEEEEEQLAETFKELVGFHRRLSFRLLTRAFL